MVTFFCIGKKSLSVLQAIPKEYYTLIDCVVLGRDKGVIDDCYSEILAFLNENNIKSLDRVESDGNFQSAYLLAVGWRWLIKASQDQKVIVFHDSLLPKYRGFNPLVTALIKGDEQIGVTALFGSALGYDRGEIINQSSVRITYPIKIADAIELMVESYIALVNDVLMRILKKKELVGIPMNEGDATYSLWRDEQDYYIDWNGEASTIKRMIDAVGYPYKGARTTLDKEIIIIKDSTVLPDEIIENRNPGKIIFKIENQPAVVCGKGILLLNVCTNLQGEAISFDGKFRIRFN